MASDPAPSSLRKGEHLPPAGFALLAGMTIFWGANWPALKISLSAVPVWSFRSLCLVGGGLGLLLIARLSGRALAVPRADRGALLLVALFNVIGWHLFSGYGVSLLPAGRAVIVAFTMPLWVVLLSSLILGERLTSAKLTGLALGIAGLGVLIGPDLLGLGAAPLGAAMMLSAAISWAFGTVLIKRHRWSIGSAVLAGWQLLIAAPPIILGAAVIDGPPQAAWFTLPVILAIAYVLLLPMIFCQWAYFETVRLFPAGIAAIGTLAIPVVGVFSSALVLGEATGPRELISLVLVCAALAVVLLLPALKAKPQA